MTEQAAASLTVEELTDLIDLLTEFLDDEPDNPDVQCWQPIRDKLVAMRRREESV